MSYFPGNDWDIEVRKGNVPKHSVVSIIGHAETVGTQKITITPELSTGDIDQSDLTTTAATVDVASTSANDVDTTGTGLRTLLLMGLSGAGVPQSETIALNGQTEVTSVNTYSAVLGFRGLTAGTTNSNEGVIWVGNGVFTAGLPATKYFSGDIEFNKGHTAYYVVPAATTFLGTKFIANLSSTNKDVEFFIETSVDGIFWVTEVAFGMTSGATMESIIRAMPPFAAGTHIRIRAESTTATTDITVILDGYLLAD